VKIAIALPMYSDAPALAAVSWIGLDRALTAAGHDVAWKVRIGDGIIQRARNRVCGAIATGLGDLDELDVVLWLDADTVVAEPEAVQRMLETLHTTDGIEFVAAASRLKRPGMQFSASPILPLQPHDEHDRLIEVTGVGASCMAWSGQLFQHLVGEAAWFKTDEGDAPRIWREGLAELVDDDGEPIPGYCRIKGEDLTLCDDLRGMGITLWCDMAVPLGHVGAFNFAGTFADFREQLEAMSDASQGPG